MKILGLSQSPNNSDKNYAVLFIFPEIGDGMLDVQMQFDTRILGLSFEKEKATFVISSEDANPDTGFAFGIELTCKSTLD